MVGRSVAASVAPVLPETVNAPSAGVPSGNSPDPRRYRALYPDKWHMFLHSHFRDSLHVGFFFGVSERTARDWWEGVTTSQGWAVAYAIDTIPGAGACLKVAA